MNPGDSRTRHIHGGFDRDLRKLEKRVRRMGEMVAGQIERLRDALAQPSAEQMRQVIDGDRPIDLQEIKVDRFIVGLLARRAPVGRDLREVVAVSRIVTDLERMGDEMAQIARVLSRDRLPEDGCGDPHVRARLREATGLLGELLERAMRLLSAHDLAAARAWVEDGVPGRIDLDRRLKYLVDCAFEQRREVAEAASLVLVLRSLERGLRHVENIAGHVVYLESGEDLRHR